MKKMLTIVGIGLILFGIVLFVINSKNEVPKGDVNEIVGAFYGISGDSLGSSKDIIYKENKIIVEEQEAWNTEPVVTEYDVPQEALEELREALKSFNYNKWDDLELSEEYALDAGTERVGIYLADGTTKSVSEYNILPQSEEGMWKTIMDFLNKYSK